MSAPTVIVATDDPPVRVRRAPKLEPPFDDEHDPAWPPVASAGRAAIRAGHVSAAGAVTALAQPGRGPRTQRPVTPRPLRGPTEPPGSAPPGTAPPGTAPPGTAPPGTAPPGSHHTGTTHTTHARTTHAGNAPAGNAQAPGPRPRITHRQPTPGAIAAQRFVSVCIEILNGHRAVSHLRAVTAPGDLKQITDQLVSRTNRTYLGRPGRTAPAPQRVRLVGMRTCEPRDGVVEVVAVLAYGINTWAMAIRMERPADVWLCRLIQVI